MPEIEVMMCPMGHGPMNCHAEKPVEAHDEEEAGACEKGAVCIEQIHTCPICGALGSRRLLV